MCIIKDHWINDYPGKLLEHDIVTKVKSDIGSEFCRHFINICGHRKTVTSGALGHLFKVLETKTSVPRSRPDPHPLIPTTDPLGPTYITTAEGSIVDQDHHQVASMEQVPTNTPHPQCRYQVVYDE